MSRKAPKPPPESTATVAARDRQVLDLAKLDDEENKRIKQMRTVSRGVRAFRAVRGAARGRSRTSAGVSNTGGDSGGGSGADDSFEAQYRSLMGG